jgi:glycosyltransferase involved in cell wall biosynthesis
MQLFVLGMHRSGTSGVTRLLNMAGAYFGPEGISNGADEGNPRGYWERRDVRAECDGLLKESGFDWWKLAGFSLDAIPEDVRARHLGALQRILLELDAHRPWVVKEPRLSMLFPLLRPHLEAPVCIHVTREPLEVAESLEARNGFPAPAGVALWELYTIHALRASAGLPRLQVRYADLIGAPVETTGDLVERLTELGADGLRIPTEQEITAFITPDLHRQHRSATDRRAVMNEHQVELAAAIDAGAPLHGARLPDEVSEGALRALRMFEEYRTHRDRIDQLDQAVAGREERIDQLAQTVAARDERVDQLAQTVDELSAGAAALERRVTAAGDALGSLQRRIGALKQARTWRLAEGLSTVRRRLTPGTAGRRRGPLDVVIADLEKVRGTLDPRDDAEPPGAVPTADPATRAAVSSLPTARRSRPKVAVLAWDVGHNPLGRAHTLAGILARRYDVEIWGARFPRYGSEIWAPLRDSALPIRVFPGHPMPEHLAEMRRTAQEIDADAVYVSKPRFPSLGLGILAKEARNRPLVLDVDDDELAFFEEADSLDPFDLLARPSDPSLVLPFERIWTRASSHLIGDADALTVSNVALHERYGGVIVPHARDERVFDPALYDRDETRRRLGIGQETRLLFFGGTPRAHKGVVELVRALERLGDDRYRLVLFDTRELNTLRDEMAGLDRWVIALRYQSFADLPALVGASDLACVLQDPDHPVSRSQFPAKIIDAMAMGVPCLVRPVPPLRPLVDQGVVHVWEGEEPLADRIARIFDDSDEAADRAQNARKLFEAEYSYESVCDVVAPTFEDLLNAPPRLTPRLASLTEAARRIFGADHERLCVRPRTPGLARRPAVAGQTYDIVMFWKQNDTGLYGRRHDMFIKYLERSNRVRSIVHFDMPTTPERLVGDYRRSRHSRNDQTRLVVRQTVRRILRRSDTPRVHYYTFLHSGPTTAHIGLKPHAHYADYVKELLRRNGFGDGPTILWGFPTNEDLPLLIDALEPDIVVADVIDDHRTFAEPGSPRHAEFERNYREVLGRSDVVLANCEPVAESMRDFAGDVHIVPNGLELPNGRPPVKPRELRSLDGPIIGYAGNLSQRLDVDLLEALVVARPEWRFVFVGSAHHDKTVLRLGSRPNVCFVGPRRYDEALGFIYHFDVALIPHVDNDMTRSMSPLKAFVYCAAGVPVVSTPVANLGDLAEMIAIARDPVEFLTAIEAALRTERAAPDVDALRAHSWDARIEQALTIVDATVGVGT